MQETIENLIKQEIPEIIENQEKSRNNLEQQKNEEFEIITIEIKTPTSSGKIKVLLIDSILNIKAQIENSEGLFQYSNYELYFNDQKINFELDEDDVLIKDIAGIKNNCVFHLKPLPYTEYSSLVHYRNLRNLFFNNKISQPKTILQFFKNPQPTSNPNKKKKTRRTRIIKIIQIMKPKKKNPKHLKIFSLKTFKKNNKSS